VLGAQELDRACEAADDLAAADDAFRQSVEVFEATQSRPELAQTLLVYGRFQVAQRQRRWTRSDRAGPGAVRRVRRDRLDCGGAGRALGHGYAKTKGAALVVHGEVVQALTRKRREGPYRSREPSGAFLSLLRPGELWGQAHGKCQASHRAGRRRHWPFRVGAPSRPAEIRRTPRHSTAVKRCDIGCWGGRRPSLGGYVAGREATDGTTAPPEVDRVVRSRADGLSATGFLPENCHQRRPAGAKVDGANWVFLCAAL
jgi:hypothetical protein